MADKEYIEREAALRANCYFCSAHLKDDSPCDEKCADYMKFMEIPAADVRENKRGRWILETEPDGKPYCFHCSVCDDDFHYIGITTKYNFCPNCGADMRGEQDV